MKISFLPPRCWNLRPYEVFIRDMFSRNCREAIQIFGFVEIERRWK